jgi:hypothetical protein
VFCSNGFAAGCLLFRVWQLLLPAVVAAVELVDDVLVTVL